MRRKLKIFWTWLGVLGCPHPRAPWQMIDPVLAWHLAVRKHTDPPPWARR